MNIGHDTAGARPTVDDAQPHDFVVEHARELLMDRFEVSAAEAERLLRTWSRQTRTPLHKLAAALTSDIFQGRPTGCNAKVLRHLEQSLRQLPYAGIAHVKPVENQAERNEVI